jgi:hypothetical protein
MKAGWRYYRYRDVRKYLFPTELISEFYNYVREHKTLGTTPAVAAGLEEERWSLERVVEMTEKYLRRKQEAVFEAAFAATW